MNVFFTKTAKKEYEAWEKSSPSGMDVLIMSCKGHYDDK